MYPPSMWQTNIPTLDMSAALRSIRATNSISPEKASFFNAAHGAFSVNTLLNQTSPDHIRASFNNAMALNHHQQQQQQQQQLLSSLFPHYAYPNPFRSLVNGHNPLGLLTSSNNANASTLSSTSAFLPAGKRFKRSVDDEILPIEKSTVEPAKNLSENRCRSSHAIDVQNPQCPICHVSLNPQDLLSHVQQELSSVERQTFEKIRQHMKSFTPQIACQKILHDSGAINNVDQTFKTRYETYIRVRTSRQQRLNAKYQCQQQQQQQQQQQHRRSNRLESRYCPICFQMISYHADEEFFFNHVQQCSRKREQLAANVALATITNQQRLTSSTSSVAVSASESSTAEEPDVNVVDMDENDEQEDNQNDRRSTNETNSTTDQSDDRCQDDSSNSDQKSARGSPTTQTNDNLYSSSTTNDLNPPKCVVCMDFFLKPTVSIRCWHIHCERCWKSSLRETKTCPQCDLATDSTDLRRIFLESAPKEKTN